MVLSWMQSQMAQSPAATWLLEFLEAQQRSRRRPLQECCIRQYVSRLNLANLKTWACARCLLFFTRLRAVPISLVPASFKWINICPWTSHSTTWVHLLLYWLTVGMTLLSLCHVVCCIYEIRQGPPRIDLHNIVVGACKRSCVLERYYPHLVSKADFGPG